MKSNETNVTERPKKKTWINWENISTHLVQGNVK